MIAARVVLRGDDAVAWGLVAPGVVVLVAVEAAGWRADVAALLPAERAAACEALWDAWTACDDAPEEPQQAA